MNPNPVGSGTFPGSRIICYGSVSRPKKKNINNQNLTSFCFNCTENTVEWSSEVNVIDDTMVPRQGKNITNSDWGRHVMTINK